MTTLVMAHTPYLPTPELDEWTDAAARVDRMYAPVTNAPVTRAAIWQPRPHSAQALILTYLRTYPGRNRTELAAALGIHNSTVGTSISRLLDRGVIKTVEKWHDNRYYPTEAV